MSDRLRRAYRRYYTAKRQPAILEKIAEAMECHSASGLTVLPIEQTESILQKRQAYRQKVEQKMYPSLRLWWGGAAYGQLQQLLEDWSQQVNEKVLLYVDDHCGLVEVEMAQVLAHGLNLTILFTSWEVICADSSHYLSVWADWDTPPESMKALSSLSAREYLLEVWGTHWVEQVNRLLTPEVNGELW